MISTALRNTSGGGFAWALSHAVRSVGLTLSLVQSKSSPPESSAARRSVLAQTVGTDCAPPQKRRKERASQGTPRQLGSYPRFVSGVPSGGPRLTQWLPGENRKHGSEAGHIRHRDVPAMAPPASAGARFRIHVRNRHAGGRTEPEHRAGSHGDGEPHRYTNEREIVGTLAKADVDGDVGADREDEDQNHDAEPRPVDARTRMRVPQDRRIGMLLTSAHVADDQHRDERGDIRRRDVERRDAASAAPQCLTSFNAEPAVS